MYARLGNALLALSLIFVFSAGPVTSTKASGTSGPIQLGGDDQIDHGEADWLDHDSDVATPDVPGTVDGWKYIMLSLKGMLATELRAGASNSIAVIGSEGSNAYATAEGYTPNDSGVSCTNSGGDNNTYCLMEVVKVELDRLNGATAAPTVTYYETAAEVTAFFNALTNGTTNVAVVFITGDEAENDLGSGETEDRVNDDPLVTTLMEQALADSALDIAAFNAQGGGVLSSGSAHYLSWLTLLLPGVGIEADGSDEIGMTADGAALWPGLVDEEISSAWHNHFTGDLGALKVLGLGWEGWTDTDADRMIDAGEATAYMWDGPDGIEGNADDQQTIAIIGGAVGEAAIGEELPPTNTNGDASATLALLVAALAAVAGLALVAADRKRLQA